MRSLQLSLCATIVVGVQLGSCAVSESTDTASGKDRLRITMLSKEYRQLQDAASRNPLGLSEMLYFRQKARTAEAGKCVEPEDPAHRHGDRNVTLLIDGKPETKALSGYREEIQHTICALRHRGLSEATTEFADVAAAEAHAQGRFDCLLVQDEAQRQDRASATCASEFARALAYLRAASAKQTDSNKCESICGESGQP